MKGSRFSEEQIIGVLREHEAGARTEEVCRRTESRARPFASRSRGTAGRRFRTPGGSRRWRMKTGG
jgi:putative transposase